MQSSNSNSLPSKDIENNHDRQLLTAIAAGNETALKEIDSRYRGRIASFTRRVTGRSDLAAEIANDTLWVIWQSAARFKGASKVSTWILGIAYRLSMKRLRAVAHPLCDPVVEAQEPAAEAEVCEWVGAALARLPEEQRTALELSYHLGHSCKEIADGANCAVGTVKTRLFYGRRKLRRLLPSLAGLGEGLRDQD